MTSTKGKKSKQPIKRAKVKLGELLTFLSLVLLLLFITIWLTWPLLINFNSALISQGNFTDGPFFVWNLWWFKKAIFSFQNPFISSFVYYPAQANLALHTPTFTSGLIYLVLSPFFKAVTSLNIIQTLSFVVSGIGMFMLVNYLNKAKTLIERASAIIPSIIFAFSPFVFSHMMAGHYNLSMIWPIPFVVLFLYQLLDQPNYKSIAGLGLFTCLLGYLDLQLSFFTGIICLFVLVAEIIHRKKEFWRKNVLLGLTYSVIIFLVIFLLPYGYYMHKFWNLKDSIITFNNADIKILLGQNPLNPLLGYNNLDLTLKLIGSYRENVISISKVALTLSLVGIILFPRKLTRYKVTFFLLLIVGLTLTLGPYYQFNTVSNFNIKLPYYYLQNLPIFDLGLVPTRFILIVHFALAVLAGLAGFSITKFFTERKLFLPTLIIILVSSSFILLESYSGQMMMDPLMEIPEIKQISLESGDFTVLPYHGDQRDAYLQTLYDKKAVTGFLGRRIHDYYMSQYKSEFPIDAISAGKFDQAGLAKDPVEAKKNLEKFKVKYIIAEKTYKTKDDISKLINFADRMKIEKSFENQSVIIYRIF